MDLTLVGVLVFLVKSTLEFPDQYMGSIAVDPQSIQNHEVVSWRPPTGSTESYETIEQKLERLDFQGNPLIGHMYRMIQNPHGHISKREVIPFEEEGDSSKEFIEETLIEHSQALEQLVTMARRNQDVTEQLLENLSKHVEKPKLPEKVEVPRDNRRSYRDKHNVEEVEEIPIVRIGKNIPKYGSLLRSLIVQQVKKEVDPVPLLEVKKKSETAFPSRRSNKEDIDTTNGSLRVRKPVQWCKSAVLCQKSYDRICGYDDGFGYGLFEDICHMLKVNCYWNFNFTLAPSCAPKN